ncbi:WD40-repeat-containing domain protein [Scheffersomyces coipomensis]|uniref:WD40-repeat-containing domain protein n=1 Tax=Scheffersomyces coipomensis TaxID=1788519 RepID=UPI00315CDF17
MASIEQDDLFNVENDDEMLEDEEEEEEVDDRNQGNYGEIEQDENIENDNDDDDEEEEEDEDGDGDGEGDEDDEEEADDEDEDEEDEEDEEMEEEGEGGDGEDDEEEEEDEEEENTSKNKTGSGGDEEDDDEDEEDEDDDDNEKFIDAKETQEDLKPPSSELQKDETEDILMLDDKTETDKERKSQEDAKDPQSQQDKQQPEDESHPESKSTTTEDNKDKDQKEDADIDSDDDSEKPKSDETSEQIIEEKSFRDEFISKAKVATEFDIIPSVAIPYTSQCHSLAFTEGPKWILTGGEDGFIRKYDFIASIQGKSPLTMAQKHNLVADSLTKAGVICSYWENEQPMTRKELMNINPKLKLSDFSTGSVSYEPKVNPVYALDVERSGYWCLSGLLSGGISLYTMRYNENTIHHYFSHSNNKKIESNWSLNEGHNNAVSVLKLNTAQDKFLSGSWDKTIREWDLNTGKTTTLFTGSTGQISNIQYRPMGLTDLSLDFEEESVVPPTTAATNNITNGNGTTANGDDEDVDSLFGESDVDADGDVKVEANGNEVTVKEENRKAEEEQDKSSPQPVFNNSKVTNKTYKNEDIFMSSSIDGTINIWDARVQNPVLRLGISDGVPPWCMSSTWSNCGEYIYAGRRNSTVEEFSIKMPFKRSSKSGINKDTMTPNVSKLLQFPKISGPVSSISTMPNNNFLLCGSNDNIRLYDLTLYDEHANVAANAKKQATPFLIIPGHQGGTLSSLYVDETGRFMVSASGNRGWGHSSFTDTVLVYEIDIGI